MRRDFPRKVKAQAILRANGCCEAVCLVQCTHCTKPFDRGYRISSARAARPQYCSPECRGAEYRLRAKHAVASAFWKRTERQPSGCLHWTGRLDRNGYGRLDHLGIPRLAHRVAYELTFGESPEGKVVCHSCDNPTCVEPKHLWLGDQSDNVADMISKKRGYWQHA